MELGFHIKQVDARARVHDFFYLFAFSRENRFSHEKASTLLSICRDVFDGDMGTNDPAKHMGTSFERLEGMLLRHAVFRPPKSIGVFDEAACFTRRLQCTFTQVLPFGVEEPAAYRPLVELLPLGEAPPAVLEPDPEPEEEGGEAEDGEATGEEPPADEVA
ncbi:flagellar C1a complex subunit C1a-32 [Aureococcus anophagefferens]|nr:flagellar C1a complex subunit C1a-32 [Aureococcus anophagefferens]